VGATRNRCAMVTGFAEALVKVRAHGGGPPVTGQGLVVAAHPPSGCPQVRDAWDDFKQCADGEIEF
jgi:hypothetical protein